MGPVVDTHQEILYPLDFSYKILSKFEGETFCSVLHGAVLLAALSEHRYWSELPSHSVFVLS